MPWTRPYLVVTFMPSWANSSVSIAISLPIALRPGPSTFTGHAWANSQLITGLCSSLSRLIVTERRSTSPDWMVFHQSQKPFSAGTMPRLSVTLPYLRSPGILRTVSDTSSPDRYSIGSLSSVSPLTSEKLTVLFASPHLTVKWRAVNGWVFVAIGRSLSSGRLLGQPLVRDAEHHELGGLHRRGRDLDDHQPLVDVGLGHGLAETDADAVGLLGRSAREPACAPYLVEEVLDRHAYPQPGRVVVGLEDHPLGRALDRALHEEEEASYADVHPLRVVREVAGAPDALAPAGERADQVHALGVQGLLAPLRVVLHETHGRPHPLVRRRLEHAALRIRPREHAHDVTARRNE